MEARDPVPPPTSASKKRPGRAYQPPAVSWEEALDVRANLTSACDKIAGQGGLCDDNPAS